VRGIVQGVGFRPFVYTLATGLGLGGFVGNDGSGVFIEIEGPPLVLDRFEAELAGHPPPLAQVEHVSSEPLAPHGETEFHIVASEEGDSARTFVAPDVALCADCRRELFDPADRRYHYPFINCTNCGPRFTIIYGTPYDRPLTTMRGLPLCAACRREYEDPANRRFHAQPVACPQCGPQLTFYRAGAAHPVADIPGMGALGTGAAGAEEASQARTVAALGAAQAALARGEIVAIKGLGGFHLACDAASERAVAELRARKGRGAKPLAVMAANLDVARWIAHIDDQEAALLQGSAHPIVLLRQRAGADLAERVAPGNGYVGVMLPYTPLHELIFCDLGSPAAAGAPSAMPPQVLVMTSGNRSEEPITWRDEEALVQLAGMADAFLLHNRPIHTPCDDSVVRIFDGRELPIRRARGYAPMPILLPAWCAAGPARAGLLAVGADLKSTFCLAAEGHAVLSQHIGDMGNLATYDAFTHAVDHLQTLFHVEPAALICDAHPLYFSTRWAHEHAAGRPVIAIQHHHAHIAAVLAEHGACGDEPVIGFSFDGTGYGTDGAIWGGEVLLATCAAYTRRAHLRYVPLPGGDAAVQRPYRTALAHLWAAGVAWTDDLPPVQACPPAERLLLLRQLETGFNAVPTSSIGRLCDAVAALAGICQIGRYEAQAAIELEALAGGAIAAACDEPQRSGYRFDFAEAGDATIFDAAPLIRQVVRDVRARRSASAIAADFHAALAALILRLSRTLRVETGIERVALSGGVFQNVTLLSAAVPLLRSAGFTVIHHRRVPPNDGGLALGQIVAGAAMLFGQEGTK
jgi:hydrogenase maturation protein HypF